MLRHPFGPLEGELDLDLIKIYSQSSKALNFIKKER